MQCSDGDLSSIEVKNIVYWRHMTFLWSDDVLFFTLQLHFKCEISKLRLLQNFLCGGDLLGNCQVAIWKYFHFPKKQKTPGCNGAHNQLKIVQIIARLAVLAS